MLRNYFVFAISALRRRAVKMRLEAPLGSQTSFAHMHPIFFNENECGTKPTGAFVVDCVFGKLFSGKQINSLVSIPLEFLLFS